MPIRLTAVLLLTACPSQHDEALEAPAAEPVVERAEPITEAEPAEPAESTEQAEPVSEVVADSPSRFPLPSSWTSAACEGRAYERQITFTEDRYQAKDLVSPCPPGVVCVWSGIIDRTGSWTLDRKQLRLTPDVDAPTVAQASNHPLPAHLWLGPDGTLTEDEGACPYARSDD